MTATLPRIEIDGLRVSSAETTDPSALQVGHFTAMQVRDRRARGIALHLRRLDQATRELFGAGLDDDLVRDRIRHALGGVADASIRVYVVPSGNKSTPAMIVTVKPPGGVPPEPLRLLSVVYERPLAHLKQLGHVGQREAQELARHKGCDDALLVDADGLASETASANIGFLVDATVVWPAAPMLDGITMQLLDQALADRGAPSRREELLVADAASHDGVIVANARGIAVVGWIDDTAVPVDLERVRALVDAYESVAWDAI